VVLLTASLPPLFGAVLVRVLHASEQQLQLMQCFSLLLLGAAMSTLATLNFSLAFVVGVLAAPLSFCRRIPALSSWSRLQTAPEKRAFVFEAAGNMLAVVLHLVASPPLLIYGLSWYYKKDTSWLLLEMAKGWAAQGVYTSFIVWNVWWPAWVVGGISWTGGIFLQAR
jgi:GPI-anchor transamidase subunit GAA1